ncbi:MAG: cytochrome nitrite reductase [Candidatus Eremiobacteraeota bacterium]|nr:cytochrome nitrite reductase [Candidatus Eremiobacteraeota bacterium]
METHTVFERAVTRLSIASCILGLAASGCANQTVGFPTVTNSYVFAQTVAIPGVPPSGGWQVGFGVVDQADGVYVLADRSTAGVDVVRLSDLTFLRVAGHGSFAGNRVTPAHSAGPNSVTAVGNGVVFASDGNSNIVVVDVNTGATLGNVVVPNTGSTTNRVDLLGYDPKDKIVLAGNDSATPAPVVTFVSTVAPYPVLGQIFLTNATGGVEQPTYDPAQGVFLLAVPSTTANPSGEIDVINPTTRAIVKVFPVSGNCLPTGTDLGPNEELAVSCSNVPSGSQVLNATTGASLATIPAANGCDQVWYNPSDNRFYYACSHDTTGSAATPLVAIVDASSFQTITTIPTAASSNTVAVDAATNHVFIPERSGKGPLGLDVFAYL